MLYNPVNKTWAPHWPGVNHLVKENYLQDEDRDVVTVGRFTDGRPTGLTWQWRSKGSFTNKRENNLFSALSSVNLR